MLKVRILISSDTAESEKNEAYSLTETTSSTLWVRKDGSSSFPKEKEISGL